MWNCAAGWKLHKICSQGLGDSWPLTTSYLYNYKRFPYRDKTRALLTSQGCWEEKMNVNAFASCDKLYSYLGKARFETFNHINCHRAVYLQGEFYALCTASPIVTFTFSQCWQWGISELPYPVQVSYPLLSFHFRKMDSRCCVPCSIISADSGCFFPSLGRIKEEQ